MLTDRGSFDFSTIRYCADEESSGDFNDEARAASDFHERTLAASGLQITKEIMPGPYGVLQKCVAALGLQEASVDGYVFSTPNNNAYCFAAGPDSINIAISSSMIRMMRTRELAFVIGHELGHAFFGHLGAVHVTDSTKDFEQMRAMRAREISADRTGFLCAGNVESTVSAMIKTASGLDESVLKFNVGAFIDQSDKLEELAVTSADLFSTHPPMPIRARAVLWFSLSDACNSFLLPGSTNRQRGRPLSEIDARITRDLVRFIDGQGAEEFLIAKNSFQLAFYGYHFSLNERLSRKQQAFLRQECGESETRKFLNIMRNTSARDVPSMLCHWTLQTYKLMRMHSRTDAAKYLKECAEKINVGEAEISALLRKYDL